jgi:hypothetical protein
VSVNRVWVDVTSQFVQDDGPALAVHEQVTPEMEIKFIW